MREGDEAQIAPVPLDCGVVLELQQANLQQPIDMVLNQEGDEDHALGRLQDVALLESLPQLWNVWHLLARCPEKLCNLQAEALGSSGHNEPCRQRHRLVPGVWRCFPKEAARGKGMPRLGRQRPAR